MLQTLREKQIGKKKNGRIEKINTARHDFFSHLLGQNWVSYPFIYRCSVGLDALFCISMGMKCQGTALFFLTHNQL